MVPVLDGIPVTSAPSGQACGSSQLVCGSKDSWGGDAGWLSEVQGIYLITDASNGKQYIGRADGAERILGRWTTYARDGHGGNVALRELAFASTGGGDSPTPTNHARQSVFSILRVFGPSTSSTEVNAAESHYKRALMTREFGLNRG